MDKKEINNIVDKTFLSIFGVKSPFKIEEILSKFAFDVKLPQKVLDSTTGKTTWAYSINPHKFITQSNMEKYDIENNGWLLPKKEVSNLQDIIKIWKTINYTTTERQYDCVNVLQCDPIYRCENAFRCTNCNDSKNLVFSDGCSRSEYVIACQRSDNCSYCLRVDDSNSCSNSYNVVCSAKISNSFFIQDCNSLHECMFCSHISNKKYCISNMQFEKEEYFVIKKEIIKWILSNTK